MTAVMAEPVSGRTILRHRGAPVEHDVRWYAVTHAPGGGGGTSWRPGALQARCDCGWQATIDGGHATADLVRLAAQHAGAEDPP